MSSRSDGPLLGKTMDEAVPDVVTKIATTLLASGPVESFEAQLRLKISIWLSEYNDYWAGVREIKVVAGADFVKRAIEKLQELTVARWREEMEDATLTAAKREQRIALYSKIFAAGPGVVDSGVGGIGS